MPKGRLQASSLRQLKSYLGDMGMAVPASDWAMAWRMPKAYRRKVDPGHAVPTYAPVPDLTENVKKWLS